MLPSDAFTETVVLDGTTFKSRLTILLTLERGNLYKGEAERVIWRAGWAIARALDSQRSLDLGIDKQVGSPGWEWYSLNEPESTIGNEPEEHHD